MGALNTLRPCTSNRLIMPNHPNRSRRVAPAASPPPEKVRAARETAGLSQTGAAALIYCTLRGWQEWEAGNRRMHPGLFELFKIKTSKESC